MTSCISHLFCFLLSGTLLLSFLDFHDLGAFEDYSPVFWIMPLSLVFPHGWILVTHL